MSADPAPPSAPPPAAASRPRWKGGRPRRLPGEQRSATLPPVRVTPLEIERVRAAAEDAGLSVSDLLRHLALGRPIARAIPRVDLEAWARLGPLAANLNQYVKAIHQGQAAGAPLDLLLEMRDLLDVLRQELRRRDPEA